MSEEVLLTCSIPKWTWSTNEFRTWPMTIYCYIAPTPRPCFQCSFCPSLEATGAQPTAWLCVSRPGWMQRAADELLQTNQRPGSMMTDQSESRKCSCCFPPPTLSSVCCWFSASKYLTLQRIIIQSLDHKKSKHGENCQGKNYSQSHALSWQILHGNSRLLHIFILDKLINNQDIFSICGCFWWRDLVSVLLCVCGLHNCLCISSVKVKTMFLIPKIQIFP